MVTVIPIRHEHGRYVVAMVKGAANTYELMKTGQELAQLYGIVNSTGEVKDLEPNSRDDGDRLLIVTQRYSY